MQSEASNNQSNQQHAELGSEQTSSALTTDASASTPQQSVPSSDPLALQPGTSDPR